MSYEFVHTLSSQRREVDFYKSELQIDVYKSGLQISVLATDRHGAQRITTVGFLKGVVTDASLGIVCLQLQIASQQRDSVSPARQRCRCLNRHRGCVVVTVAV